ncbi:MAG: ATP phosphoribosyltransferase, partial [Desulforhopalus sp.]
ADRIVALKMNFASDKLDEIVAILPSVNAPTVASLYHQDWYSVETVVSEDIVRELIPQLKKLGAEGIIEYALNKII